MVPIMRVLVAAFQARAYRLNHIDAELSPFAHGALGKRFEGKA